MMKKSKSAGSISTQMVNAAADTTTLPIMHSMFSGNIEHVLTVIRENGWDQELYANIKPVAQWLNTKQLIPLETQRKTYDRWILKVLAHCQGFDWVAFNSLSVAHDKKTGKYYVFDGCGRLALAQIYNIEQVPCLVFDLDQQSAAHYFAFMQDEGRRKMDPETLFINKYYSGNIAADIEYKRLLAMDCYILGNTEYPVPQQTKPSYAQIKHAFLTRGYVKAGGRLDDTVNNVDALTLMRESVDLVKQAWFPQYKYNLAGSKKPWTPETGFIIRQDLYMGLITLLRIYPEFRINNNKKMHGHLADYLRSVAESVHQKDLPWKKEGENQHNHEDISVAWGLYKSFWNNLTGKKHEKYVKERAQIYRIEKAISDIKLREIVQKTEQSRKSGAEGGKKSQQLKIAKPNPADADIANSLLVFQT
jgi:hypothetical protein